MSSVTLPKKSLKEELMEEVTEKLIEKILDMVNQKVQDALKKFQDTTNKEFEKTQKQLHELKENFNKHQSETKDTIKTEIYELKMRTQNIKEELNKDMENLRNKNQTEILEIKTPFSQTKNTVEGHFSRLEQVEDRISELKKKIKIKEKPEELLVKQLKSCERNMQELSNSIKRLNLSIKGIEEGEECKTKGYGIYMEYIQ
jgi:chromosome segregation ATPase